MEPQHYTSDMGHPVKLTRKRDVINLDYLLSLAKRYWYLFPISVPLAFGWVYVSLRYDIPQYQGSCTMMIKDSEGRTPSGSYIIEGISLPTEEKSIENQIFMMKSYRMVKRAIDRLDFQVEYYSDGRFKDIEFYDQLPFKVWIDSMVPHVLENPVRVELRGDNRIKVSYESESANLFLWQTNQVKGILGATKYEKEIQAGDTIHTPFGRICIRINRDTDYKGEFYYKFRTSDAIASEFRGKLNIAPHREGNSILVITASGKTPSKIKRFLDEFSKVVVAQNLEQKDEIADKSLVFIQSQLANMADTLEKTQNVLLNYKRNFGFRSPLAASEQTTSQYYEAEKSRKMLEIKRDYYRLIKSKLHENPYSSDFMLPVFTDDNVSLVSNRVMQIMELNNEIAQLKRAGNNDNPYMLSLEEKNSLLRRDLLLSIDKFLDNLAINEAVLQKEVSAYEQNLNQYPEFEREYMRIERKYKLTDAIYTFLLQKNSEMQISKASNTSNCQVIDQASVWGPTSPIPSKKYQRALMFGLLIPVGLIALIEFLNVKIRSKEELENLIHDIPIIGTIPHGKINMERVIISQPRSVIAESFRSVRTRLNFMTGKNTLSRTFTITSTNTGDGKTFFSINLASVFALAGKKTIILGFDLRKPKLNAVFGLHKTPGISNYLIGDCEIEAICYPTDIKGLHVMPSGEIPPNPSELIGLETTAFLFEWLKQHYDVILIDSPPIGVVSDARILMQYADSHLFIVRSNHTRKDHLQLTLNGLMAEKIHGLGIVLNDLETQNSIYGNYHSDYNDGKGS